MTAIRDGEIHPFLTKIETIFFPRTNRINRLSLFFGQLGAAIATVLISLMALFLCYAFVSIAKDTIILDLSPVYIFIAVINLGIIIFSCIVVRGSYYRLQDFNVDGKVAYQVYALILIFTVLNSVVSFYAPKVGASKIWYAIDTLSLFYSLVLTFMPGTKGPNKFGQQPGKPGTDEYQA